MQNITLIGFSFIGAAGIAEKISAKTGFKVLNDQKIIEETSREYGMCQSELARSIYHPSLLFNGSARKKMRHIAALKVILAKNMMDGNCVYWGYLGHLVPEHLSLRVLVKAGMRERNLNFTTTYGKDGRKALRHISLRDKSLNIWNRYLWEREQCENAPYDLILSSEKSSSDGKAELIVKSLAIKSENMGNAFKRVASDFFQASVLEKNAVGKGFDVTAHTVKGEFTLTINQKCLFLERLKRKLKKIAGSSVGERDIQIRLGKGFHRAHFCYNVEYSLPIDDVSSGIFKTESVFYQKSCEMNLLPN